MKAVTLLGRGPSWPECTFTTEDLWGCSTCLITEGMKEHDFTKVFAFDTVIMANKGETFTNELLAQALEEAKRRNIPIVSPNDYATEPFPVRGIVEKLRASYFMPTMSYMIAYAIYLEFERICIHGIDMGPQWFYQLGKPHISFWIGYAVARGIDVRLGMGSLRWQYQAGLEHFPVAFLESENHQIANCIPIMT